MYVIKVKGKNKITDHIQLRDDKFTLVAYFRIDKIDNSLEKHGLSAKKDIIKKIISTVPFGKIHKLEI